MLFIIDMQNEYVDKKGKKYIKDSEEMVEPIIKKIKAIQNDKPAVKKYGPMNPIIY